MGSVGEDEFQPTPGGGIAKNDNNLFTKFLGDSGGVDYSMVPRKQRSVIRKRVRESIIPPFPITLEQKQNHESNEVAQHKSHVKKSKRNKKKGRLTKDEKEVAETLHALANMFSDTTKTNTPGKEHEPSETKTSTSENGEESKKISTRVSDEAGAHSLKLVNSTASQIFTPQSVRDETVKTDLAFEKQSVSVTPGVRADIRQKMPLLDMNRSDERAAAPIQVTTHFAQRGKRSYHPRSFGSYQSPSLLPPRDPNSKTQVTTQGSSPQLPAWLENAVSNSKPQVKKKTDKEGLQEKPSQLTTSEGARCVPIKLIKEQANGFVSSSGRANTGAEKTTAEIQNVLLLHDRLLQDQQLPFQTSSVLCSSTKQAADYSPLGARDGQMNSRASIHGAGNSHEVLRKLQASYLQSQSHFATPFLLPRSGYSSDSVGNSSVAASQQGQVPPFTVNSLDNRAAEPLGQQFWPQQQKWPFHLQAQYNHGGVAAPVLADWKHGGRDSSSQLNYSQALFTHAHSAKYQQHFSQPQQQFMAINSSVTLPDVNRLNPPPHELQKRWFFASTNL